jgi:hypothetical protein
MKSNSYLRSSAILFLGAGVSAPLGKKMMGDFVTHISLVKDIGKSNLFQAIASRKHDLEFLLQELGELESKAYIDDASRLRGTLSLPQFQGIASEASTLIKNIKREVFLHYRSFDNKASEKIRYHLLPLFDAASKALSPGEPLVVFSTNYDPAVEEFVQRASGRFRLFDGFEFDPIRREDIWSPTAFLNWKPSNTNHREILLIKLHGSTNWIEHSGRISRSPGPGQVATDDAISNVLVYPAQDKVAAIDPFFTAYYLFEHFLKSAKRLIAVGYSFRDLDATTRLRTAMIDNRDLQVGLVAPNAEEIREMLERQFIRAVAIPGIYDPTNAAPHFPSSPRGDVVPKIEAFFEESRSQVSS